MADDTSVNVTRERRRKEENTSRARRDLRDVSRVKVSEVRRARRDCVSSRNRMANWGLEEGKKGRREGYEGNESYQ